jgi:hypothetical protein
MKRLIIFLAAAAASIFSIQDSASGTTFGAGDQHSWGGNVGWLGWAAGGTQGAAIGEYVCSGYLYGANIGWIHLGGGASAIPGAAYYANTSATNYGVNAFESSEPLRADLRGFAYGANVGWIAFDSSGKPQVNLTTGAITGYAWGGNIGWINLGQLGFSLITQRIEPGADTDGDGLPDAWELLYAGSLAAMDATTDSSGNGMLDREAYYAGLDPFDADARLAIIAYQLVTSGGRENISLTWTSVPTRQYRIERSLDLGSGAWTTVRDNLAPGGATTTELTRTVNWDAQFYRVVPFRSLLQ